MADAHIRAALAVQLNRQVSLGTLVRLKAKRHHKAGPARGLLVDSGCLLDPRLQLIGKSHVSCFCIFRSMPPIRVTLKTMCVSERTSITSTQL